MAISVGSVAVDVVPSARHFSRDLQAQLADQEVSVRAKLDDKGVKAELTGLSRDREAKLGVVVDDRAAKTKLDKLTRPRTAKVKVDDGGTVAKTDRQLHLLSTAIVGLAPAVAPFAGAIAAATAAAGGLGIAGILAVKGISDEMKAGTPLGLEYRSMLNGAKGDLTQLEQVASAGVLTGFNHALGDAEGAMPKLRAEIGSLSNSLGSDLGPVTHGVLSLFLQLSPVMNQAGGGIHALATGFDRWASGPGGQQFVAYLQKVLPEVAHTLQELAQAGAHVVDALLPLGSPVLKAIDALSFSIDHIPVIVIQDLFVAFTAYRVVNLATAAVEGFTKSLVALGIVEKAVGAGSVAGSTGKGAAAVAAGAARHRAAAAGGLSGLIDAAGLGTAASVGGLVAGTVGAGVVAAQLIDSHQNALDRAGAARLTQGGPAAIAAARAQLVELQARQSQRGQLLAAQAANGGISQGQARGAAQATSDEAGKIASLKNQINLASKAMAEAAARNKALGLTADGTRDAVTGETVALSAQIAANDKLSSANVTAKSSQIAVAQALADSSTALKQNGKTLDLNSQKGRDNRTALLNLGTAMRAHIDALAADGTANQEVNATLSKSEDRLIKVAEKFGLSASQARAYADQVLGLPKVASVHFTTPGLGLALQGVNSLNAALDAAYTKGGQLGARLAQSVHGTSGASGVPVVSIPGHGSPSGPGSAPGKKKPPKHAASGVLSSIGGVTEVGEFGRELAYLQPRGAIIPHHVVAAAFASAAMQYRPDSAAAGARSQRSAGPLVAIGQMYTSDPDEAARAITVRQQDALTIHRLLAPA